MKIISGKKTIAVEYENGKKGLFSFDAKNEEAVRARYKMAEDLKAIDLKEIEETKQYDFVLQICKDVLILVYGKRNFNTFWKKSYHNVESLIAFVNETVEVLKKAEISYKGLKL